MKSIYVAIFVVALLCSSAQSWAENDYVLFAKSLRAKDYDSSLPAIQIEQWLKSILPRGAEIVWGNNETDCGEQTGDPEIDKERYMPLCVEINLKKNDSTIGYLSLVIGTEKKGKLKKGAGLYYGFIKTGAKETGIRNLRELKKLKPSI